MKQITVISKTHGTKNILLDDEDFEYLNQWKWCVYKGNKTYYACRRNSEDKIIILHRLIMNESNSKIMIDHIDHNGLNCQRINMRRCDKSTNAMNSTSQVNSSSDYLGVSIHVSRNTFKGKLYEYWKWNAKINIKVNGKRKGISLGVYENALNAARAYNSAALRYYGEFANINIL